MTSQRTKRTVAASILTAAYHMIKDGTSIRTSAQTTSTTAQKASKFYDSSTVCKTSVSPSRSPRGGVDQVLFSLVSTKEGVVYAKPPFGGPDHVLKYLAR
jgi:hypothetical protein